MKLKVILFFGLMVWSSATVVAEDLYTDTYMQNLKRFNSPVKTGITNGIDGDMIRNGEFQSILRFDSLYYLESGVREESKDTFSNIIKMLQSYHDKSYYLSIIGHTSDYIETGHEIILSTAWSRFWHDRGGRDLTRQESYDLANGYIKDVYEMLIKHGADPKKIYTENRLGKDKSFTEEGTKGTRWNNRVDVVLYLAGNIDLQINFKLDSAIIEDGYYPRVDAFVAFMKASPDYNALIIGHTDEQASDEYNMDLSKRRAQATKQMIVGMGIEAKRIAIVAKGEREPIDTEHNEEAYRKNRRIEAQLIQKQR